MLPRRGYGQPTPTVPVRLRFLPGNMAYLQVNELATDAGFKRFVAAFDSIKTTRALIIDLHQNGGGSFENGFNILSYLTSQPYRAGSYQSRIYSAVGRARGAGVRFRGAGRGRALPGRGPALRGPVQNQYLGPGGPNKRYTKLVAVRMSGETFSAAEDFCAAYVGLKRGALVGEATGGIRARVCTKRYAYPDGTEWNGIGSVPTVAALQAGRAPVLEAALRTLGALAEPAARKSAQRKFMHNQVIFNYMQLNVQAVQLARLRSSWPAPSRWLLRAKPVLPSL
ncbi:S41 family peptidase [Hymenobacter sp. H14-R3]|uniref:S41 family peptidase n=1 Tax=Hymenobacter sp. H14-R3 TaxID=3046308 RepID=UPI0024BA64FC|nr:S41 family peptidase [Hymenobacter sp. H14-R3]MDJ0366534.1 S41 family peptidase [Hymenobacter sp. H14-R3]